MPFISYSTEYMINFGIIYKPLQDLLSEEDCKSGKNNNNKCQITKCAIGFR